MTLPPFLCLTLRETPHKEQQLRDHLALHTIKPRIVYGPHGDTVGIRSINPGELAPDGSFRFCHQCITACCLTHWFALSLAVTEQLPEFIIAEDDVILCDDFVARFTSARSSFSSHDVVQLEYCCHEDKPTKALTPYTAQCSYPFGAACIWWTLKGATLALQTMGPLHTAIDIIYARRVYPYLSHAITTPRLAHQRSIATDQASVPVDRLSP